MDKREVIDKVNRYADVIKAYFPVKMVILFGSYARGNPREASDIDVAVVVDQISDDCLESEAMLNRLRRSIDLRIEPVLIEKDEKDPEGFFEEIMRTGEIIYQV
jgi:predicted nucleotidyltransferase